MQTIVEKRPLSEIFYAVHSGKTFDELPAIYTTQQQTILQLTPGKFSPVFEGLYHAFPAENGQPATEIT